MYPSGDVREILYGTYSPLSEDCLGEEFCAQQLTMAETVTPQFDPYYNIRYSHPETSRRVKYLKKLIHNAAIEYLNTPIKARRISALIPDYFFLKASSIFLMASFLADSAMSR